MYNSIPVTSFFINNQIIREIRNIRSRKKIQCSVKKMYVTTYSCLKFKRKYNKITMISLMEKEVSYTFANIPDKTYSRTVLV